MRILVVSAVAVVAGGVVFADGPGQHHYGEWRASSRWSTPAGPSPAGGREVIEDLGARSRDDGFDGNTDRNRTRVAHSASPGLAARSAANPVSSNVVLQAPAHDLFAPAEDEVWRSRVPGPVPYQEPLPPEYQTADDVSCATGGCQRCCRNPCGCSWPCGWYWSAEALWLRREIGSQVNISVDDERDVFVLNTHALDFDYEPGIRIMLGRVISSTPVAIEGGYFGLHNWHDSASVTSPGNDLDPYWGDDQEAVHAESFEEAYQHRISYSSRLHSAELSVRRWLTPGFSVLAGVRYIKVRERFHYFSQDDEPGADDEDIGFYNINTDNGLIGTQLGFRYEHCPTACFRWGLQSKFGLMSNFAEQESRFVSTPSPGPPTRPRIDLQTHEDGQRFSSFIDAGLYFSWRMTGCLALRGGYNVFFVNGLALAPDQLDTSPVRFNSRGDLYRDNASVVYHGPSVGLEWLW
jgi:hypothetical protein